MLNSDQSKLADPVLICVAWPYANGDLHLGHPSGNLLPAGILNDFFRLQGRDVIMVSGSDMHGTPIAVKAWQKGVSPEKLSQDQHKRHVELIKQWKLNYSLYTSTATALHQQVVQQIFLQLEKNGYISKEKTEQFWSEKEHKFLLDRYIEGECPHCHYAKARGDQCDNCGRALTPEELINPYSIFGDNTLAKRSSTNYYLLLDKLQPMLDEHYQNHPNFANWRKHVASTTKAWLEEGLTPRAITRDMEGFGVQLPLGYEIEGESGKVIYVWFEAVSGYLSAAVELALRNHPEDRDAISELFPLADVEINENDLVDSSVIAGQNLQFANYWLNPAVPAYYFMGKDNIPFHSIIWTAMLLGLNECFAADGKKDAKLILPWNIPSNQYLNLSGSKFSKSLGNIIDSKEFVEEFGLDAARYYLISRMPENKDYDFTWQEFIDANNTELLANMGNLVNRTLVFWNRMYAPLNEQERADFGKVALLPEMIEKTEATYQAVAELLLDCKFSQALQLVSEYSTFANRYFATTEIWQLVKTDFAESKKVIRQLMYLIANLANLLQPFLPDLSAATFAYLGIPKMNLKVGENHWQAIDVDFTKLSEIKDLKPLVAKLDPAVILPAKLSPQEVTQN